VNSNDEGEYNCVAMNLGGMAEKNVSLTFSPLSSWPGKQLTAWQLIRGVQLCGHEPGRHGGEECHAHLLSPQQLAR